MQSRRVDRQYLDGTIMAKLIHKSRKMKFRRRYGEYRYMGLFYIFFWEIKKHVSINLWDS